jgi:hypothetical protein
LLSVAFKGDAHLTKSTRFGKPFRFIELLRPPVPLTRKWSVDGETAGTQQERNDGRHAAGGNRQLRCLASFQPGSYGSISADLSRVAAPAHLKLYVGLRLPELRHTTGYVGFTWNDWDIWVYPAQVTAEPPRDVFVTSRFRNRAVRRVAAKNEVPPGRKGIGNRMKTKMIIFTGSAGITSSPAGGTLLCRSARLESAESAGWKTRAAARGTEQRRFSGLIPRPPFRLCKAL